MNDLTGKVFTRLTVLARALNGSSDRTMWYCRCECGTTKIVAANQLRRGKTKSCGCLKKDTAHLHKRLRPHEANYNAFVASARHSNHVCKLTYEAYLKFTKVANCHYCAASIPWKPYTAGKKSAYFLDRKDNSKGYTVKNCVVCCSRCNYGKGSVFSYSEWIEVGRTLRKLREEEQ
jgi:hypothetical protein